MLTKLSDIPTGEAITQMVFGPAGSGKTAYAGTIGDDGIIIDCENRPSTLKSAWFKEKIGTNPYIHVVTEELAPSAGPQALQDIKLFLNNLYTNEPELFKKITTICIDGGTAVRRFALNQALELNQKLDRSKTLTRAKSISNLNEINYIPTNISDIGTEIGVMESLFIKLTEFCKENGKHLLFTAHERVQHNKPAAVGEPATVNSIKPGFSGQTFPDTIPGFFDLVWHSEVSSGGAQALYRMRTVGDEKLIAKTCYGGIFPELVSGADFRKVVKCIKENTKWVNPGQR
jgi:hypothetical protein